MPKKRKTENSDIKSLMMKNSSALIQSLSTQEKKILQPLLTGKSLTLRELCKLNPEADVAIIVEKGLRLNLLLRQKYQGFFYYKIADAGIIKELQKEIPPLKPESREPSDIRYCRTCYGHLAGFIGVTLTDALLKKGYLKIQNQEFIITEAGDYFFKSMQINSEALRHQSGIFAKTCLDFSERRFHLGGKLGSALFNQMQNLGWLTKTKNSRLICLTEKGKQALTEKLDLPPSVFQ